MEFSPILWYYAVISKSTLPIFAHVACQPSQNISAMGGDQGSVLLVFPIPKPRKTRGLNLAGACSWWTLIEIENNIQLVWRRPQQTISKRFKAQNKGSASRLHWFGPRYNTHCVTLDKLINFSVLHLSYPQKGANNKDYLLKQSWGLNWITCGKHLT